MSYVERERFDEMARLADINGAKFKKATALAAQYEQTISDLREEAETHLRVHLCVVKENVQLRSALRRLREYYFRLGVGHGYEELHDVLLAVREALGEGVYAPNWDPSKLEARR